MNTTVRASVTLAILALPAGLAHAGEGNGEPFGLSLNLAGHPVPPPPELTSRTGDGTATGLAGSRATRRRRTA